VRAPGTAFGGLGFAGLRWTGASGGLGKRAKFNLEAELGQLADQPLGFDLGRAAAEVVGAEVAVFGAVLQHVVDGGEHRCGDLISSQASRSAIQVASLTSDLRPGTFLMCAAFATINSKAPSLRRRGVERPVFPGGLAAHRQPHPPGITLTVDDIYA